MFHIFDENINKWIPWESFENKYSNLDMLFKEEKGIGAEFLELIDVDGWKICKAKDYPNLPDYYGFVVDMEKKLILCHRER